VDNEDWASEVKQYLQEIAPDKADMVKLYSGTAPIFQHFNVDRQVKTSFGRTVTLQKGAYLIIEHTEALHVIDVNSGNRGAVGESQEEGALAVNLLAAEEVARQLRLRDMGGIIVVDFIDLHSNEHRRALYDKVTEVMSQDRAKHKILAKTYVVKKDEFSFMLNKCTEVGASDFACCSVSRRSTERGVLDCLL
jgi:ribonuclease G